MDWFRYNPVCRVISKRISTALLTGLIICLHQCAWLQANPEPAPGAIDRDYYFLDDHVQIQGQALLPPPRESVLVTGQDGNTKTVIHYLSLQERRKRCRDRAVRNGHTKWLSLTEADWQMQSEWDLRLGMNARGSWSDCLEEAQVRGHFYDTPDTCRVVLLYACLPQNY